VKVDWLTSKMREANFTVSAMHGDMPQKSGNSAAWTPVSRLEVLQQHHSSLCCVSSFSCLQGA